jgi:hypothetical protein
MQEYTLQVQVQPGLEFLPFTFEVILPKNSTLVNPEGGWQFAGGTTWTWSGSLDQDTEFSLTIQTDNTDLSK